MTKFLYFMKCSIIYFACHLAMFSTAKAANGNLLAASRLKALETASIDEIRDLAVSNCEQAYFYGEILRGYVKDFLLVFLQEQVPVMSEIQEQLRGLGISEKEISDLRFLQEVTDDEMERMVSHCVDFLDDFLHTCKLTCQGLNTATSSDIEEDIKNIKLLASNIKIKIFTTAKDIKNMLLEFYDFVQAMMMDNELHEVTYAVEDLFEDINGMFLRQKTTIIMGRKKFLLGKMKLINSLGELVYKLKTIEHEKLATGST